MSNLLQMLGVKVEKNIKTQAFCSEFDQDQRQM
jgi:hypothetical protein